MHTIVRTVIYHPIGSKFVLRSIATHLDETAIRPLHHSGSRGQVVILQWGDVIVHNCQGVEGLDEVVVVHPQVLKVMCER